MNSIVLAIITTNSRQHKDKGKDGEKYSDKPKDKGKEYSQKTKHKDKDKDGDKYSEKHKDKGKEYSEKNKDKDKHKTPGSSTASNNPSAPGTGGTNRIHPILSPLPVASSSGGSVGVTPPVNTIHPISSPAPVASGSPAGVTPPVNTIVRDHRHPPAGDVGPQSGLNPDGYTTFEDFDSLGLGHLAKGVSDFGYGLTHGTLGGGPAPEDPTSTSTQY